MYRYLDRTLSQLEPPAMFLVGAMRDWVWSVGHERCPCRALIARFAAAGLGGTAFEFGTAMAILNRGALDMLRFGPPGYARISDDEARLLALFDAQNQTARHRMAAVLVEEAAVARLTQAIAAIVADLAASPISARFD
ncbi:MAG: hypothetical protein WDN44_03445 [Sphingomonas sp.]